jgi:putative peptide zinc metalloprotease protein
VLRRRLLLRTLPAAVVAVVGLTLAPPPAAADSDSGRPQDNGAVAFNTKDGSSLFRLAFEVRRVVDTTVDSMNYAVAVSSCSDCRTVAIAFQIIVVDSSPDTFVPENAAVAVNYQCQSCETMAQAYQFVVGGTGDPLRFTGQGQKRLNEIRRRLRALDDPSLTFAAIQAELDAIAAEVADILSTELVVRGSGEGDDDGERDEGEGEDPSSSSTSTTVRSSSTSSTSTSTTSTSAP